MLRGHVFIVNEQTLPIHLGYMFVGTSSGSKDNNISLLADMFRVKGGDIVFFYIEGRDPKKGRFFGIFKALDSVVYHILGTNALSPNLPVKLIYRKTIVPHKVYGKGVFEWIALDKLPTYAKELLWSLIYRKMKAGRGNTMLLPWEVERLISLIQNENSGNFLNNNDFTFDIGTYQISPGATTHSHNHGNSITLGLNDIKKTETYFQAYILQNLTLYNNNFLPDIFGRNIIWIGNEVFAGSGMQKIDILTIEKLDETTHLYRIIELKHPKSLANMNFAPVQLDYYTNWAREDIGGHILGGRQFNIKPMLVLVTDVFNSIPQEIISGIGNLNSISSNPEIYELDFSLNSNKVL